MTTKMNNNNIKIKELIVERQKYALQVRNSSWPRKDEWIAKIIDNEPEKELVFIARAGSLYNGRELTALREKYHIIGVYGVGVLFTNIEIPFYIVHLSQTPAKGLNISLFKGKSYTEKRTNAIDRLYTPECYTQEWERYIRLLENWINGGRQPEDSESFEFGFVPNNRLRENRLLPECYTKEIMELQNILDKQDTKALSDFADILLPVIKKTEDHFVKVLNIRDLSYPLDISKLNTMPMTSVLLQKGDLVIPKFHSKAKAFLFNYSGKEHVYASQSLIVVRCKEISPEYLYFYLNSDIAVKVMNARRVGIFVQRLTIQDLRDLPIALPEVNTEKYVSDFNILTNYNVRNYEIVAKLESYRDFLTKVQKDKKKPNAVEDILNIEVANNIKAYKEEQLRSFLNEDLRELNTCFRGKAYKATLILAGSILEAVLIDWLSEIHNNNYFEEEYYVEDRYGNIKRADLIDYINEIKEIRKPKWMMEAKKAHEIRKKRNLVHAKLCMKSDEINEEVCREVISYLEDVLKTRGVGLER